MVDKIEQHRVVIQRSIRTDFPVSLIALSSFEIKSARLLTEPKPWASQAALDCSKAATREKLAALGPAETLLPEST